MKKIVIHLINLFTLFCRPDKKRFSLPLLNMLESVYLLGMVPLELYCTFIHRFLGLQEKLPFLPLMMMSCYCAAGVTYSWLKFYWNTIKEKDTKPQKVE